LTLANQNIEALIVLCKQGNQLAQMEVYNRYQKAMYNVAMRILKDSAEAEDMMQESFITAFSRLDSFNGTSTFGAWLKRIVINNSLSQYRKNSKVTMLSDKYLSDDADEGTANEDASLSLNGIGPQELLSSMKELNATYFQVLNLHYIEGYDYEEICEIMNISYGHCRTTMSRAKSSLRKKLSALA
jgi:RNA polymerase sigma-70 factor (ECF subfamily)